MNCARCRWGPGTTSTKPPNTENAKQLESSLSAMIKARNSQDSDFWESPATYLQPTTGKTGQEKKSLLESKPTQSK